MTERPDYLDSFFRRFGYPASARESLGSLAAMTAGEPLLETYLTEYRRTGEIDYGRLLDDMETLAEKHGVSPYETQFLAFVLLSEPLLGRYREAGIPEEIWVDSMTDLRCKLTECEKMYGVEGSFVACWFCRFFDMTRFALGRLQFETAEMPRDYVPGGLKKGETVINVHIPSRGKLPHEAVLDSYRRAWEFYPQYRRNGLLPIICFSWLLYPRHAEFLPPSSNILAFANDYTILDWGESEEFDDAWRIYYRDAGRPPEELPTDTPLRAAYTAWLRKGGRSGVGSGILLFDGEKVIRP